MFDIVYVKNWSTRLVLNRFHQKLFSPRKICRTHHKYYQNQNQTHKEEILFNLELHSTSLCLNFSFSFILYRLNLLVSWKLTRFDELNIYKIFMPTLSSFYESINLKLLSSIDGFGFWRSKTFFVPQLNLLEIPSLMF